MLVKNKYKSILVKIFDHSIKLKVFYPKIIIINLIKKNVITQLKPKFVIDRFW